MKPTNYNVRNYNTAYKVNNKPNMNATFASYKSTLASTPSGSGVSHVRNQKMLGGFSHRTTLAVDLAQ